MTPQEMLDSLELMLSAPSLSRSLMTRERDAIQSAIDLIRHQLHPSGGASDTVRKMRSLGGENGPFLIDPREFLDAADELQAAYAKIAILEKIVAGHEDNERLMAAKIIELKEIERKYYDLISNTVLREDCEREERRRGS